MRTARCVEELQRRQAVEESQGHTLRVGQLPSVCLQVVVVQAELRASAERGVSSTSSIQCREWRAQNLVYSAELQASGSCEAGLRSHPP